MHVFRDFCSCLCYWFNFIIICLFVVNWNACDVCLFLRRSEKTAASFLCFSSTALPGQTNDGNDGKWKNVRSLSAMTKCCSFLYLWHDNIIVSWDRTGVLWLFRCWLHGSGGADNIDSPVPLLGQLRYGADLVEPVKMCVRRSVRPSVRVNNFRHSRSWKA